MKKLLAFGVMTFSLSAFAVSPRQQAKNIHDSLTGVQATNQELDELDLACG